MRYAMAGCAAAVALLLTAQGGDARAKPDCLRSGRTVAANSSVRIFYRGDTTSHLLYECWVARRKVREIGETFGDGPDGYGIDDVSVRGRFVAFSRFSYDRHGTYSSGAEVRDARSGRTVTVEPTSDGRAVTEVVATTRGAAAYIEVVDKATRVIAIAGRTRTVLDEAPGIERGSLAVAGSRVYWIRAGEPRSATIR